MTQHPNILIVMCEHFSGLVDPRTSSPLEMPNLAQFADSAINFTRSYCNAPVCGPSRLSFLTGLYPCNHGGYDNGSTLAPHIPTFGHLLTSAGYQTALCGRMHIHGMDQHRGFEYRPASEIIDPREGAPALAPSEPIDYKPLPPADSTNYEQVFVDSPIYKHDQYVTDQACKFMTCPPQEDKPYCLVTGFFDAHPGAAPDPQHEQAYKKYLNCDLPVCGFSEADYKKLPEHAQRYFHYASRDSRVFDPQYHHHKMAIHYAALESLDKKFGQILDALDKSGQADNTIVIFTADHGEMMSRHGMWGKMIFYEPAQRIPLYVRMPAAPGGRAIDDVVSLVDLAPTLVEVAAQGKPDSAELQTVKQVATGMDGRSLLSELRGATSIHDPSIAFSEYHGYLSACDIYMAADHRYKLCHYTNETDELYDLELNPQETKNLIDNPAYQAQKDKLLKAINQRVDIKAVSKQLRDYRLQRQASYDGIKNSAVTWNRINERNKYWRDQLNEPWWDSGKYLEQSERRAPEKNG